VKLETQFEAETIKGRKFKRVKETYFEEIKYRLLSTQFIYCFKVSPQFCK
jgi:hypothetical protein